MALHVQTWPYYGMYYGVMGSERSLDGLGQLKPRDVFHDENIAGAKVKHGARHSYRGSARGCFVGSMLCFCDVVTYLLRVVCRRWVKHGSSQKKRSAECIESSLLIGI